MGTVGIYHYRLIRNLQVNMYAIINRVKLSYHFYYFIHIKDFIFGIAYIGKLAKLAGNMIQVFNLLNHKNFGSYNAVVSSATFGAPQQNNGNAYRPRTAQLAEFTRTTIPSR